VALTRPGLAVLALFLLAALVPAAKAEPAQTTPQIVVYRSTATDAPAQTRRHERDLGFDATHSFRHVIKGFSARLTDSQIADLRADPNVAAVVPDRPVQADSEPLAVGDSAPTGIRRIGAAVGSQVRDASGVAVAEIDTGIDLNNSDLNAAAGTNCVRSGDPPQDDNGHGTHVAGTIGALNNGSGVVGVAPGTKIYAVKVLTANGSGSDSQVICGLDWVAANASALGIKVVNMSLGGTGSPGSCANDPEHAAICTLASEGVTVVAAAGNSSAGISAGSGSHLPAAYPEVLTVTAMSDTDGQPGGHGGGCASDGDDTPASFSNWASSAADQAHVIAGPGDCITSTKLGGGTTVMSGTSMATPHVTGAVALCIDEAGTPGPCADETPAQVITTMQSAAARASALGEGFLGDPLAPVGRYYGYLVQGTPGPHATTGDASSIVDGGATVAGTISTDGQAANWWFEYGPSADNYDGQTSHTPATPPSDPFDVQSAITGLDPGTTYHYRTAVQVGVWTAYGPDQTFTTTGSPPPPPPDTTIESGPNSLTSDPSVSISFDASPAANASGFECRLDSSGWSPCASPYTNADVGEGSHTFSVRSLALNGKPEATPPSVSWTVDETPPETSITGHPLNPTTNTTGSFGLTANEGATFECRLDGAPWAACNPTLSFPGLTLGTHTFEARATDDVGLTDATPAVFSWTIVAPTTAPQQQAGADAPAPATVPDNSLTPQLPTVVSLSVRGRLSVASAGRLDRRGRVGLRLTCSAAPCGGTLELRAGGRQIARITVALPAGTHATRLVRVSSSDRRTLARARRFVVRFSLVAAHQTDLYARPFHLLT
jgi:subtilisin